MHADRHDRARRGPRRPDGVDVTSVATIPADQTDIGDLVARADGVVAGLAVAAAVFDVAGGGAVDVHRRGSPTATRVGRGDILATVTGPTRALLTAERTALNLLCRMSGVATHTRAWADALAGTRATVLDTRKTTPGLRVLEKYAVRAGGGTNKRMGLYDVAMVKDNHKLAAGGVAAAYRRVRDAFPDVPVQVEVTTRGRGGGGGRGRRDVPALRQHVAGRCCARWWPRSAAGPSWRRPAG